MSEKLDFHTINDQFLNMGAISSPSALQGLLCGKVCGGQALDQAQWHQAAIDFLDLDHVELAPEQLEVFDTLRAVTLLLMDDMNFTFEPLLPEDGASLTRRTQELAGWCEGFLHGVGTSGLQTDKTLSSDVADALRDLAKISQVDLADDEADEENEVYWNELVEYVKVAVLNVYTELSEKVPSTATNTPETKTVH